MSRIIRVGVVGLGGIAQKAYLPILTKETNWVLVGAFTPNADKRERICKQYRIKSYHNLSTLASACDAMFVHSSTDSHYEVVSYLLENGIDVYVDKPLAASVDDAQRLAELSDKYNRKLMVGFNRRFAPMYKQAKQLATNYDIVRLEKHRADSIGPKDYKFTLLDDYLHVVDTLRWLAQDEVKITNYFTKITSDQELIVANHTYQTDQTIFDSSMHRQAGSNLERLELLSKGSIVRVENMNTLEIEKDNTITTSKPGSWETILKTRGFEDCIHHFITCVANDSHPDIDGWEAVKSQSLVQQIIDSVKG